MLATVTVDLIPIGAVSDSVSLSLSLSFFLSPAVVDVVHCNKSKMMKMSK